MIVSEELIEGHLRVIEVCENKDSVIIGDLPLIHVGVSGESVKSIEVGGEVGVRFVDIVTDVGNAEIEVYHVMGTAVAVSFVLRLKGCGHNLQEVYSAVVRALRNE